MKLVLTIKDYDQETSPYVKHQEANEISSSFPSKVKWTRNITIIKNYLQIWMVLELSVNHYLLRGDVA